jgi:hypothetical protein
MLIDSKVEKLLQDTILPDLKSGRGDFDLKHTLAVVYWMKKLIENCGIGSIDSQVLITAAYAHDWGYVGLFDTVDSNNLDEIMKMKPLHMIKGAEKISHLLSTRLSDFYTTEQIQHIAHLVEVHDRVEALETDEELLLMEADTLGMIDTDVVVPTFSKADHKKHLNNELLGRRIPHFRHEYAKQQADTCLKKLIEFYKDKD